MRTFDQVLDWAGSLPPEDQENLISVLQRRLRDQRRAELVEAVRQAREEFNAGGCRSASPGEIMDKILD